MENQNQKAVYIVSFIIFIIVVISLFAYVGGFKYLANQFSKTTEEGEVGVISVHEQKKRDTNLAFDINDFDNVIRLANELINEYPKDVSGYLSLAVAYLQQGTITGETILYSDLAKPIIDRALQVDPVNAEAYRLLANYHELRMEWDEALEMFNKSVGLDPLDDAAYTGRGHLYYILGNDILAEADYKNALDINAFNAQAITNLALLYMRTGQVETIDVEEMLLRSIEIETGHNFLAESYNALGVLYLVERRFDDAISSFTNSIRYNQDLVPAINGLSMSHIQSIYRAFDEGNPEVVEGHLIKAIDLMAIVKEKDPDYSRVYLNQGIIDSFAEDYVAEKLSYEKGLSLIEGDTTLGMQEKEQVRKTFEDLIATF